MTRRIKMDSIARYRLRMKIKNHMTWGGLAIAILLVVEIAWIWALWRVLTVALEILAWGGKTP
jgi:hypothetical protein|tara:strand:- start:42 stop:230 length:189 start_codon:yes stop_codon:yes gene_type:complete